MNNKKKNLRKKIFSKYVVVPISIALSALISTPKITAEDVQKNLNPPKTYTSPFEWTGHISPEYNAWATGDTLTSSVIRIDGPAQIKNARSYQWLPQRNGKEPKFQHFNKAYFKVASPKELEEMIGLYEKDNRFLKSEALKNSLTRGVYLPLKVTDDQALKVFDQAIKDGELTKEELDRITNGVYGFWYVSEDGKAYPLPGIIHINYDKSKQEVEEPGPVKEPEKEKKKLHFRPELGFDYQDGLIIPQIGIKFGNDKFSLGPTFGYSQRSLEDPDEIITSPEDPVTGFYGYGVTEKSGKDQVLEALFGAYFGLGKHLYIGTNAGISYLTNSTNVNTTEQIRNREGNVVAENKDSYSTETSRIRPKFTGELGINNIGNEDFKLGIGGLVGLIIDLEESKVSPVFGVRGSIKF